MNFFFVLFYILLEFNLTTQNVVNPPRIAATVIGLIAIPGSLQGLIWELTNRKVWPLLLWTVVYETERSFQFRSSQSVYNGDIRWNTWTLVRAIPGECGGTPRSLLLCTRMVMNQQIAVVASRCSFSHSEWLDIHFFRQNTQFLVRWWLGGGGGKLGFSFLDNFSILDFQSKKFLAFKTF